MPSAGTFAAEAGAVVVGWALVLVSVYRQPRAQQSAGTPGAAPKIAAGAKVIPAAGLGVALLVALAAFTLIAVLDGLNLGLRPSVLDAGGAWCVVALMLRRITASRSTPAVRGEPGKNGSGETRRKFPVIPVVAMNFAIFVVCLLYYWGGQPAARMIALAAVAYVAMNATALVTWKLRRDR